MTKMFFAGAAVLVAMLTITVGASAPMVAIKSVGEMFIDCLPDSFQQSVAEEELKEVQKEFSQEAARLDAVLAAELPRFAEQQNFMTLAERDFQPLKDRIGELMLAEVGQNYLTTDFHDPCYLQLTQDRRESLTDLLTQMEDLWENVKVTRELQAELEEMAPAESGPSSAAEARLNNVRAYLERVRLKRAAEEYESQFRGESIRVKAGR